MISRRLPRWIGPDGLMPDAHTIESATPRRSAAATRLSATRATQSPVTPPMSAPFSSRASTPSTSRFRPSRSMLGAGATGTWHRYAARVAVTTLTTVDGVRLAAHLHHVARPRGTVVLAHGFTASATHDDVEALARALVQAGYDVVTYDARGHGASTGWCTLGDLERHDVAAAARAARPESGRVVLVGLSMGAIAVLR